MQVDHLKCPLCHCPRRQFFCSSCISGGDFAVYRSQRTERVRRGCSPLTPSSPYIGVAPILTRFADVQLKYLSARAAVEEVERECESLLAEKRREKDDVRAEIAAISRRKSYLSGYIREKEARVEEVKP
jgi:hypothetical protein